MSYYHTSSIYSPIKTICAATLSPLSQQEETKYLSMAKPENGDKKARDFFLLSNLRYAISMAKPYQNRGLDFDEVIVEGYFGLEKALKEFHLEKNNKFITYAKFHIRNAIQKAINECGYGIRQSKHNLSDAIKNKTTFLSLDTCTDSDDEENLLSHISDDRIFSPEEEALRSLTKEKVWEVLGNLPQTTREIVILKHGLGKTQKEYSFAEIGAMYNKTKQWAFNKYKQAEIVLKEELKEVA